MSAVAPITAGIPSRLYVDRDEFILLHKIVEGVRMLDRGAWHERFARQRLPELVAELEQFNGKPSA